MLILFLVRKCWRSLTRSFISSPRWGGRLLSTPHRAHVRLPDPAPRSLGRQAEQKTLPHSEQERLREMKENLAAHMSQCSAGAGAGAGAGGAWPGGSAVRWSYEEPHPIPLAPDWK